METPTLTLVELKAKAYDLFSELQQIQAELQSVNSQIGKIMSESK